MKGFGLFFMPTLLAAYCRHGSGPELLCFYEPTRPDPRPRLRPQRWVDACRRALGHPRMRQNEHVE